MLQSDTPAGAKQREDAFTERLGALGRKEGINLLVDRRYAEGNVSRLPALAEELMQGKPDVIFAPTRLATEAFLKLTRTIPVVFANFPDPVQAGIVTSLARPGGNATGFTQVLAELTGKRLELLKEAVPRLTRLAALDSGDVTSRDQLEELRRNARSLGIEVIAVEAHRKETYEAAFAAARQARAEALFVFGSIPNSTNRVVIGALGLKYRLPTVNDGSAMAEAGGLIAYGVDYLDLQRRAAEYVDRILKGARPADLPVQRPTVYELVINLNTAKAIGVTVPQSLLLRANRVIE
jgi:putative ABC transport system substrate-binding protein